MNAFGRNFEEAREKAQEILGLWLEELAEQGKQIRVYRDHPIPIGTFLDIVKQSKLPKDAFK